MTVSVDSILNIQIKKFYALKMKSFSTYINKNFSIFAK